MSGLWKKYEQKIKAKRDVNTKRKAESNAKNAKKPKLQSDELIVQRLSSSVEGKAQKYSRIGPREFIPYKKSDITLEGIKDACLTHFQSKGLVGKGTEVDVLAGERGPTCNSLHQIPDLKLIHVRIIPRAVEVEKSSTSVSVPPHNLYSTSIHSKVVPTTTTKSARSPIKTLAAKVETFPKSLSISAMLGLGKVVKTPSDLMIIDVYTFHLENMTWSLIPLRAEFQVASVHFGEGGFRRAYQATSPTAEFQGTQWVLKKYLPSTIECVEKTNQSLEDYTKKTVQTHMLAKSFADQLQAKFKEVEDSDTVKLFSYNNIFMGKVELTGEFVTIEEYINGSFKKYVNNDGAISCEKSSLCEKAECLAHFSFEKSYSKLMLLDIQGAGHTLCDPEIASAELLSDDDEYLYCGGNLSVTAITNFCKSHKCNIYCSTVGLKPF